ncbi:MAG: hypothetical protein NC037_01030 [Bacteroides sp.]|nr:hypothetical protein [Bacillota bacterium]MCM1393506.1 hypothetical protein [[Eubacterium] siraeum]MCM1455099.1 hypothetical protein [Bacteroides sp.]
MARKNEPRNEIRDHKRSGHPAYIYEKVGDEYKFLGITHAPITRNMKNIPLEQNPNPQDKRPAYIKPKSEQDKKSQFGSRKKGWRLSKNDRATAKKITDKNDRKKKRK